MGNCDSSLKKRNRGESSQEEIELPNRPHTEGNRRRRGGTQRSSSLLPTSLNPPEQQTQTVGQESNLREVAGADFNNYMRVDKIEGDFKPIDRKDEIGHAFQVTFHVTNTTSESLKFTSIPPLEWKEIIHKQDSVEGKTTEQLDQYAVKPTSLTFYGWRRAWDEVVRPNETKQVIIQDNPRLGNIYEGNRTVSRSLEFDVGVPENGSRLKAGQNLEVKNGVKQKLDFRIH
ncbi:hypothetical protein [uncultured Nostoc sp.]|uniref:hypothetical protein n=1 Tax=uncultured Nostoc sp. TaxID=340711 RepID=UPI0035CC28FF